MPRDVRRIAGFVFLLALLVRLAWCTLATVTPISDCRGYHLLASGLLQNGRYDFYMGTAWRTPAYPLLIAGVYAVLGEEVRGVALVQAFIGAFSAAAVVVLAAQVASRRASLLAGVMLALWPTAVVYTPVLITENLAALLLLLLLLCVVWAWRATGWRATALVVGAGVLFGLSLLTRPASCFFAPALLTLLCYDAAQRKRRLAAPLVFAACALVTLSPWLIRNYRLGFGPFTLSTQGGLSWWWGNNPQTDDGAGPPPRYLDEEARLGERARGEFYRAKVETWLWNNPGRYLDLCRVRAVRYFGTEGDWFAAKFAWPTPDNDRAIAERNEALTTGKRVPPERIAHALAIENRHKQHEQSVRLVVAPLMLLALGASFFRWRTFALVNWPVVSYVVGLSLTAFVERYRVVSDPLLLILLGVLLSDLLFGTRDLGGGRGRRMGMGALAILLVLASLYVHKTRLDQDWYRLAPFRPPITRSAGLGADAPGCLAQTNRVGAPTLGAPAMASQA